MSVMHQIPGVALNLVSPQKLQGDMVNIFSTRGHVQANIEDFSPLFSSLSLFHFFARIPFSVFQTSVLLRTNQRFYFTNVTLSRL